MVRPVGRGRRDYILTEEIWLPVVGYEGLYEVSSLGAVRRVDRFTKTGKLIRGRVLKVRPLPSGRPRVNLCKEGRIVDAYPYRLALEAFVGPCPPGMEALHWDDDHSNNAIENLRWGTRTDNMRDMSRNGNGNAGLTECPAGHPYDEENTYYYPTGRQHRLCRTCQRERSRRRVLAKKENNDGH